MSSYTGETQGGQLQRAADEAREQAGELASSAGQQVRDQVDQRSTQMGQQARSVARALRSSSEDLRQQQKSGAANMTEKLADQVERLGSYLERVDADTMLDDVERFGRRRPWLLAGAGAVVGLAASRFLKASSERRYRSSSYPSRYPLSTETPGWTPVTEEPMPVGVGTIGGTETAP